MLKEIVFEVGSLAGIVVLLVATTLATSLGYGSSGQDGPALAPGSAALRGEFSRWAPKLA